MDANSKSNTLTGIYNWALKGVIEKQETPSKSWFPIGMGIGVVMLSFLAYSMYQIFIVGHHTLAGTKEVPWNLFIVVYAVAISSLGLSYIASFGIVLGLKQFDVIAKRATFMGIIIIIPGMLAVTLDMRQPLHSLYIFLTPHLTSPLAIVAISISIYLALVSAELYVMIKHGFKSRLLKVLAIGGFAVLPIVHSYHGAIFGLVYSRGLWAGAYYSLFFLVSALYASCAFYILVTYLTYKMTGQKITVQLEGMFKLLGKILLISLILGAFFLYWKITAAHYFNKPSVDVLLTGPYKYNFWIGEVVVMYVLPILMIAISRFNIKWVVSASFLALIGLFYVRWNFIIGGQLTTYLGFVPFSSGGSGAKLATYTPNFTEISGAIGLVGITWTSYILGIRYLPLGREEQEELQTEEVKLKEIETVEAYGEADTAGRRLQPEEG